MSNEYKVIDPMQIAAPETLRVIILYGFFVEELDYSEKNAPKAKILVELLEDSDTLLQIAPWGDYSNPTAIVGVNPYDIIDSSMTLEETKEYMEEHLEAMGFTVGKDKEGEKFLPVKAEGVFEG